MSVYLDFAVTNIYIFLESVPAKTKYVKIQKNNNLQRRKQFGQKHSIEKCLVFADNLPSGNTGI